MVRGRGLKHSGPLAIPSYDNSGQAVNIGVRASRVDHTQLGHSGQIRTIL